MAESIRPAAYAAAPGARARLEPDEGTTVEQWAERKGTPAVWRNALVDTGWPPNKVVDEAQYDAAIGALMGVESR